nr:ABC transporter ATP-binding protein [Micromonospora sp. DSM 115978]
MPRSADRDWSERPPAEPGGSRECGTGIEVRGLSTGYPTRTISQDLNTQLPAGRITSIVGPNGCGKSTLLSTGSRILPALAGSFTIDGIDTARGSRRALSRRLASVRQGPPTPSGFLVEDLVAAGRFPHQKFHRQWSRRDNDRVGEALRLCHLEELRYREVDSLSGGQRQRAWIAMALAQDAPYLFLDEPTTFLDIGHQIEVLDLVIELNRAHGHTVVMVLHDLNLAARYSDHLIVMKGGVIHAEGSPSEIIDAELVREVFAYEADIQIDPRTGRPMLIPVWEASPATVSTGA